MLQQPDVEGAAPPAEEFRQIQLALQIKRLNDGSRKITNISEVVPDIDEHGRYSLRDIYSFVQTGRAADGKILGEHVPMGVIPSFMDEIELNRLPFPRESFEMPAWLRQRIEKTGNVA